jgi:adenosine kinase
VQFFDVPKVPSDKIVDTNGAGDAFVGAFLAQYIKNEPLEHCVRSGIWLAGIVIQQNGCTLPNAVDINEQECF